MTCIRYTAPDGAGVYGVAGRTFEPGDEYDVPAETADRLVANRQFEYVDTDDADGGSDGDDFSANGWLENDYEDRADAVLEGGLDDHLDEIEDVETSDTVIDAVEERREELED